MLGTTTFRLEPPRLRLEEASEERHATWFELFFDLVFAAAVVELATGLAQHPSATGFARFTGIFIAITWAWTGFTVYANRFDTDDLIFRLTKAAAAFAIAAIAIEVPRLLGGEGGSVVFALGYAVVRLLLVGLYVRARFYAEERGRKLVDIYIAAFSFTAALWVASVFVSGDARFILWGVALALDLCVPPFAWRTLGSTPIVVSHITERYGVFFIVVLGVSIASVVETLAGFQFSAEAWVIAGACFIIALCLWWIYFDLADTSVVGRGALGLVFLYGHFPLFPGVAAFAAGTTLAITHVDQPTLEAGARWALAGGIAAFALALAIIHLGAEWTAMRDRAFLGRLVLIALLSVLAAVGGGIDSIVFVLVVTVAVFAQLLLEAFTFPTGAASILEPPEPAAESASPQPTS